jgi:polysaccharide biosynthesis/export protein PslD
MKRRELILKSLVMTGLTPLITKATVRHPQEAIDYGFGPTKVAPLPKNSATTREGSTLSRTQVPLQNDMIQVETEPFIARQNQFMGRSSSHMKKQSTGQPLFSQWTNQDPPYVFFPGDEIEIVVPSAPDLSRRQLVGPDGRIRLPYLGDLMAAYRTADELESQITNAYAKILVRPQIALYRSAIAPIRVLVAGEVQNPGWVDMNASDLDILSAIYVAGGPRDSAKTELTQIIRRSRQGMAMRTTVNIKAFLKGKTHDFVPLKRLDIVYVPRKSVSEAGLFIDQWINNLIPAPLSNYFSFIRPN